MEEEDVLEFQDAKCSELLTFVKEVIDHNVVSELAYTSQPTFPLSHNTTYGLCQQPFGVVRTRIIEFMAIVYQIFPKEVHPTVFEHGLYNTMLHYFVLYPFHNILHQKVCDIFMNTMEKNYDDIQ